ncbi:IclR family transcriptional regulator [Nocardioides sp. Kera G14]|uniref:IclR family transcriptional regulator n=1 Tax=Nocardioides sp. Kera G14 TaxID=2884264 RepID=UPI001D0FD339|nr:IclR family transcriptional regulator [Nocardioides sp. Kera G14]UDY23415.1 IclR family transcriptional regulator [Nocardioides sp. Kera G14]
MTALEQSDGEQSPGSRIAVIAKSARVLDVLAERPRGSTPSEVGELLKINRSTAFRLLTSLEQAGLLQRDAGSGRYRLGMKMLRYAESVRSGIGIIRVAEPTMWALEEQLRQTVYLSVRSGWGATCVERLPGRHVDVLAWKSGQWLPFHVGAGPQAILAALDDAEVDRYLSNGGERLTRQGTLTGEDVRRSVARTREQGWALNREGLTAGVASLGVAVSDAAGSPLCALSVAGLEADFQGEALASTASAVTAAGDRLRNDLIA